jgi:Skp family chaperone for outer membrane proteins
VKKINIMHTIPVFAFCAMLLLPIGAELLAQEGRIVYFRSRDVFDQCDEAKEAQEIYDKEVEAWEQEGAELQRELDSLRRELEKQRLILSPERLRQKEDEVETKAAAFQKFISDVFGPGGKSEQRNNQLTNPIIEKIILVVEKIAIENDYLLVLDAEQASIVYGKKTLDITDLVIEELSQLE